MSQRKLTPKEVHLLRESLSGNHGTCDIRLREGEYQYDLAKGIASFQLELRFPDVKETVKRSYGEDKANDVQFIRKIQTILKKMEKSNVVVILKKKNPWELQRYALSSFKFQDADRNSVDLATDEQMKQSKDLLQSMLNAEGSSMAKLEYVRAKIGTCVFLVVAAYVVAVWALIQPIINPIVFIIAFCVAVVFSLVLGRMLRPRRIHGFH